MQVEKSLAFISRVRRRTVIYSETRAQVYESMGNVMPV